MRIYNMHANSHGVLHDLFCHCREASYLQHRINIWQIKIGASDSLISMYEILILS